MSVSPSKRALALADLRVKIAHELAELTQEVDCQRYYSTRPDQPEFRTIQRVYNERYEPTVRNLLVKLQLIGEMIVILEYEYS